MTSGEIKNIAAECEERICLIKDRKADKAAHMVEKLFLMLAEASPQAAMKWIECADKILCENYLTEEEAQKISQAMRNADGTKGFYWTLSEVKSKLKDKGLPEEAMWRYNLPALAVAVNMAWSDHKGLMEELAGSKEKCKCFGPCYSMAMDLLNDDDGNFRIRKYFSDLLND